MQSRKLAVGLWAGIGLAVACHSTPPPAQPSGEGEESAEAETPPWLRPAAPEPQGNPSPEAAPHSVMEPAPPVTKPRWIGVWFERDSAKVKQVIPNGPAANAGLL